MTTSKQATGAASVRRSMNLDAPPEDVWRALTNEAMLSEWLAPEVEIEPREGGEIICRYPDGEERRGTVTAIEEAERITFEWRRRGAGASRVELSLEAIAIGTRVRIRETDLGPSSSPLLAAGWESRLASLRVMLGRLVFA